MNRDDMSSELHEPPVELPTKIGHQEIDLEGLDRLTHQQSVKVIRLQLRSQLNPT